MNNLRLDEMLKYRRPARSKTEQKFIKHYLDSIPGMIADAYGNRLLIREGAKTMISAHTDTVHRLPGDQRIYRAGNGQIRLSEREHVSNCLGADDTAGVYAALRMIQAGVKATFVFHRDEEIGGKGSRWLATKYAGWLKTFDRCVALDRRGTQDIITHQSYGRCCSDGFALALADALDMGHLPSDGGVFTDSANYVGLIPECTNISVGYAHEHTSHETLNTLYLEALIGKLIAVDWDKLPTNEWTDDLYSAFGSMDPCGYCDYCYLDSADLKLSDEGLMMCRECREENETELAEESCNLNV